MRKVGRVDWFRIYGQKFLSKDTHTYTDNSFPLNACDIDNYPLFLIDGPSKLDRNFIVHSKCFSFDKWMYSPLGLDYLDS